MDEEKLEDYIVGMLMDYADVSYDDQADLLYKLAAQMIQHLQSYLLNDVAVRNVVIFYRERLAEFIYLEMKKRYYLMATEYEVSVPRGFETLTNTYYTMSVNEQTRDFRVPVENKSKIRTMVFGKFLKCLYQEQKFDSDSERRFAIICEDDVDVLKWFKPVMSQNHLEIYYGQNSTYYPDFVLETKTEKFIAEVKKKNDLNDPVVLDKARAVMN